MTKEKENINKLAFKTTVHCLSGCAIGEVLGFLTGALLSLSIASTIILSVALAFIISYLLTMSPLLKGGLSLKSALGIAFAADTASVATMEIVDNLVMLKIPGAMEAGPGDLLFWTSLAFALAIAFVVTLPVNRFLISRNKGHVHASHN